MISPPSGRRAPGQGRRRGCLGAGFLHGSVGRDVPHHHERGIAARRHDGDPALRPSRHRRVHRSQAHAGRLPNFNLSVLVSDAFMAAVRRMRRLDAAIRGQVLSHPQGARAVGPHHARDLRLCRAGRDLHRPHQCAGTIFPIARRSPPPIPAANSRCRLMAPACWARSIWPSWCAIRSRRMRELDLGGWPAHPRSQCGCWTTPSMSRDFRCEQQRQEAIAKRRIGLGVTGLADALIFCRTRYGSHEERGADRDAGCRP